MNTIACPRTLRRFLDRQNLFLKKSLSQSFCISSSVVKKVISHCALSPGDVLVEIGPGAGAFTEALLNHAITLISIEKDLRFIDTLRQLPQGKARHLVYHADILSFPLREIVRSHLAPGQKAKLFSNLPYHLVSPILGKVLPLHDLFSKQLLILQREVAQRMVAPICTKQRSSLSLFSIFYSQPKLLSIFSPNCFYPRSQVESALVCCLLSAPKLPLTEQAAFSPWIRSIFSQKRKLIKNSLLALYSRESLSSAWKALCLPASLRPEEMTLTQALQLYSHLNNLENSFPCPAVSAS